MPARIFAALLGAVLILLPTLLVPIVQASSVTRAFAPRFQTTDRGAIRLIGNTLLTCPAGPTCTNAHNGTGGSINNNNFTMGFLDVDGDPATFDSSSADLALPVGADVLFAGLYWGAASANPARDRLVFAIPGGPYQTVVASQVTVDATTYTSFADVTSIVGAPANANGTYRVGNVQANVGANTAAGWSLVVVYRDVVTPAPLRNLTVFDGLITVNTTAPTSISTTVSGFITPATGPVQPQVGLVALEGDLGLTGDQFRINGTNISNSANPATNVFNSSISSLGTTVTAKNPNFLNQLGFDIDLIDGTGTIANSATSATLTFTTSGDVYYPMALTFAVDVFQPEIIAPKAQVDLNGGGVEPGDVIQYTIDVMNDGNDPATGVVLHDPIPAGTTYVPGSSSIVSGPGTGPVTDAAGDDQGEFDAANDRVTFRLGTGASALSGGTLATLATTRVRFRVKVDPTATPGDVIANQASVAYSGLTLGGSFVRETDGDDAAAGDQPTVFIVEGPPVARADTVTTGEDTPVAVNVLANDTDPNNNIDPTTVTITAAATNGATSVNPVTGVVTYTPAANFSGTDHFTYRVCDTVGNCDTAIVTVLVIAVDDPPTAVDDAATTPEDTAVVVNILANDSDPEGNLNAASVSVLSGPTHGSVAINGVTGAATYTPAANYNGPDTFTYQVCDTNVLCSSATVNVTVTPVNDPPVARADGATTPVNTPVAVDILANDSDVDGNLDPTSVTVTVPPTHGGVVINPVTGVATYTPNLAYLGPDTFTYRVCDTASACATAVVTLDVGPVNSPPVAVDDARTTNEDTAIVVAVLANDSDPDGNLAATSVSVTSGPLHGTATVNGVTGAITYTPAANYNGPDSLRYQVCDTLGACDTAVLSLTVTPVNDRPVARNDAAITPEDIAVAITVLANDTDVDGNLDPTSVTIVTAPIHGSTAVNPVTGVVTYTPAANYNGPDSFTYRVCDTGVPVLCIAAPATVTLTIIPVDDPPVANDDAALTNEDTPVIIAVPANDTDVDGNLATTTVSVVSGPAHGTTSVNGATGAVTYTPAANYHGADTFDYQICDTSGLCATATVTLSVLSVEDPPDAVNDAVTTPEDTAIVVDVLANDSDPDGNLDPTSVSITVGPSHGIVAVNPASGAVTYTPAANYNGPDTFTYRVCDLAAPPNCDTAIVTLTVSPVNDPPIAVDDVATTAEDTPIVLNVLANDSDIDGTLVPSSVAVTIAPLHGVTSVNLSTGAVTYTPAPNYNGPDAFTYQVCDDGAACATATVTLTVTPVEDPPNAVDDVVTSPEDTPVIIDELANDSDPDGNLDPTSVTVTAGPAHGTISVDPTTGAITYTPTANYNGPDSITYQVCDTALPPNCDSATVTLTVTPVEDPPVAVDDSATTHEDTAAIVDVLANDSDPDGNLDPTSVTITAGPTNGTVSVNPVTGAISYTPNANYNGPDAFTYQVCDTAPTPNCDTATVTMTVTAVNDAPVAANDVATTNEDTPVIVDVVANDTDSDGTIDPTSVTITAGPSHGTVSVNPVTGAVTYTPAANYNGLDSFTYRVCDNGSACDTATVTLTVDPINDPPVANPDSASTANGTAVVIDVLANDTDVDGNLDPTSVSIISGPSMGTVTIDPVTGAIKYTPNAGVSGIDTFTYQVCDSNDVCVSAVVSVTINVPNTNVLADLVTPAPGEPPIAALLVRFMAALAFVLVALGLRDRGRPAARRARPRTRR